MPSLLTRPPIPYTHESDIFCAGGSLYSPWNEPWLLETAIFFVKMRLQGVGAGHRDRLVNKFVDIAEPSATAIAVCRFTDSASS
jgi:hypothetical protein